MEAVEHVTGKLYDPNYIDRHKSKPTAFSRIRKLTFITVFILILRNSVKSALLQKNFNDERYRISFCFHEIMLRYQTDH